MTELKLDDQQVTSASDLLEVARKRLGSDPVGALDAIYGALDAIVPSPPWPDVPVGAVLAGALLTAAAFTENREDDWPPNRKPRTIIHCRTGGFGADWDLSAAIDAATEADRVFWNTSLMRHDLCVERHGGFHCFDVPRPERALYTTYRGDRP